MNRPETIRHNLPYQYTPFIGRAEEIAALCNLLHNPACRLLTLTGPGGIGKTRLALEAAQSLTFPNGISFVDLQPVSTSEVLINAIANALWILLSGPQSPREQLLSYISTREMLLLLDNFEQLLDNIDLLADILKFAPRVKLLVTSRETLNMQEEWLWQVGGLPVPEADLVSNIESYSAVQLFVECARRARHDFILAGQEKAVAHICQLVEGMPLALELAAGWTKILSCAEIAEEIRHGLDFLTTNKRDALARHRSMQVVFDHSWEVLSGAERQTLERLSVFRGGFRREAAEQVGGATLFTLAGLVDKSFLRVNAVGRYEIHELIRQYAEEYLKAVPDARMDAQHQHSAYYAEFLYQRQAMLRGPEQARALDEIEDELDNLRIGWEWAVKCGIAGDIRRAMHSLYIFSHIRAQAAECERLFELAIQRFDDEDSAMLAYLLLARIQLHWFNGKSIDSEQFLRAIRLAYTFCTEDEISVPLRSYYMFRDELALKKLFDDQQYERVCRDFLELFRTHAQPWGAAYMLFCLGDIFRWNGQLDEAESYFRQSMNDFLQMNDRWGACWSSMGLAWVMEASQQYHEALHFWEQHQQVCAEVGDRGGVVYALVNKASASWKLQDNNAAKFHIAQAIKSHLESGSQFAHQDEVLRLLIAVASSENRHEHAAELSSFLLHQAVSASAQGVKGAAYQMLDSLAEKLPPYTYRQALERGKTLRLESILKQLFDELGDYSPHMRDSSQIDALTERELQVLRLIARGHSNREIADALVLTVGTVKGYVYNVCQKLGVQNRTHAVVRAREQNLL